jgi:hypothetical protein
MPFSSIYLLAAIYTRLLNDKIYNLDALTIKSWQAESCFLLFGSFFPSSPTHPGVALKPWSFSIS